MSADSVIQHRSTFCFLLGFLALCGAASAQIFVTSTADSGPGTLRQAILDANAIPVATEEIVTIDLQLIQQAAAGRAVVGLTSMINLNRSVNITAAGNLPKPRLGVVGLGTALYGTGSALPLKVILQNLRFEGLRSSVVGGAIVVLPGAYSANLELNDCEFVDNHSSPLATATDRNGLGGAVYFYDSTAASPSQLKITHCLFESNQVISANGSGSHGAEGAAVFVKNAQVVIEDSQFRLNSSDADRSSFGGALRIAGSVGTAEVRRCTFDSNTAVLAASEYGNSGVSALHCTANELGAKASLLLEDSIFENNSGYFTLALGGAYDDASASATIRNTTFVKNLGGNSSAVYVYRSFGTIFLTHCTIWNNSHNWLAGSAVMINKDRNLATFSRSIIAENRPVTGSQLGSPDVQQIDAGTDKLVSAGYNFIGNVPVTYASVFTATGDRSGTYQAPLIPKLAEFGDYGGPTRTCPPLPDSPLVDYIPAASNVLATDQRGITRPQGSAADIGAVELPRVSYDVWDNQIAQEKDRGTTADPDKDGLSNKLEYFFGTDPTVANAAPVSIVENEDGRFVEIMRSATVRPAYFSHTDVETSIDLGAGSWSSLTGTPVSSPEVEGSLSRIRTLYPVGSDLRRFFRVGVE